MPQARKSLEEMRSILEAVAKSDLSLYAFARKHHIPYPTLCYWKRRVEASTHPSRDRVRFVEARPAERARAPEVLEIELAGSITIRASALTDPQILRRLVLALTAPC